MKKAMLFIDPRGADIYYAAPGNISLRPGSSGTLVVWAFATSLTPGSQRENRLVRVVADPGNEAAAALHNEHFYGWAVYGSSGQRSFVAPPDYASRTTLTGRCGWQLLACAWDFATGRLRAFVGDSYDSGWVETVTPGAEALRLYLGPQVSGPSAQPVYLQYLAIWDGVLTATQIARLYQAGPRYVPVAEDGSGRLTFLATFNRGYGADVAAGDGELYTSACPSADRYARVPDGQFEYARQSYFLGCPRHSGEEFDRLPAAAVLPVGFQPESYSFVNEATEARLIIPAEAAQEDLNRGPLVPGARVVSDGQTITLSPLRPLQPPCTLRLRLRVDRDGAPRGQRLRLGCVDYLHYPLATTDVFDPHGYGSYQAFTVQQDTGNTKTVFRTDLDEGEAGYWNGAYCLFVSGPNAGRALRVAAYDAVGKKVTLETALPYVPQPGDVGIVAHFARLLGVDRSGAVGEWQNLEVLLDETHGSATGYFPELEFVYVADNWYDSNYPGRYQPNYVRFERGRTVVMEGIGWGSSTPREASALFGRPQGAGDPASFFATLRLQKVEFSGPGPYQLLRADGEQGPSLADDFMVWVTIPGEQGLTPQTRSIKVWRQQGVVLATQRPSKYPNPSQIQADLKNAPWRSSACSAPWPVEESGERVVACVTGSDAAGIPRLGYIVGTWDEQAGRVQWQDEPPPAGKNNPFFSGPPLSVDRAPDTPTVYELSGVVIPLPDGKWMLAFGAKMSDPDHSQCGLLLGAEDRWSFDRQRHWWRDNPLMGVQGAVDVPKLTGGGTGTWGNRDAAFGILYDRHTEYPARRYLAYARGKSLLFGYTRGPASLRPLLGLRSSDGRVWVPLPEGRGLAPLCSPEHHVGGTFLYDDGTVALSGQGGHLRVSEDGVHWQYLFPGDSFLPANELPGEGNRQFVYTTFRLGDRRIYYYSSDLGLNMATIRYNGETYYQLADGQTEGYVETAAILCPGPSWDRELVVNADPGEGSVRVEVVEVETERVLAGFAERECEAIPDRVEHPVRWQGLPFSEVTATCVRLRFWLRRAQASLRSPRLYGWRLEKRPPLRPSAGQPKVNGQLAPAGLTDPQPLFSWEYSDPRSLPQDAYRILVASSQEKLDQGLGDVWDSGVVLGSAQQALYGGPPLGSYRIYFWKVLVRNSEGVWSE
jgi:hypothetical protein